MNGVVFLASAVNNTAKHYLVGNKGLEQAWEDGKDHAARATIWYDFGESFGNSVSDTLGFKSTPLDNVSLRTAVENLVFRLLTLSPVLVGKPPIKEYWIENIPEWSAIFATTHLSDQDVLLVANSVRNHGKELSIASQSTNFEVPVVSIPQKLAGWKRHFLPISNIVSKEKDESWSRWRYSLKWEDMDNIVEAIWKDKNLIIAGHRPMFNNDLPRRAWVWGIIIAHLTGKPLIPSIVMPGKVIYLDPIQLSQLTAEQKDNLKWWSKWNRKLSKEVLQILKTDAEKLLDIYKKTLHQ